MKTSVDLVLLFILVAQQRRDSQSVGSNGAQTFWDFDGYYYYYA